MIYRNAAETFRDTGATVAGSLCLSVWGGKKGELRSPKTTVASLQRGVHGVGCDEKCLKTA